MTWCIRYADQQVRGAVVLPHGTGKTVRVLVFAKGIRQKKQKTPELIMWSRRFGGKIQNENWFEFDAVVATPNMMGVVGKIEEYLALKV